MIKVVGILVLADILGFSSLIWNVNRPPFDLVRLQQLQPGMSRIEVRRILGAPKSDFGDHWAYSRIMAWPIVYVRFDEDGCFRMSDYDY